MVAPAMDLDMYKHPAVQYNLNRLEAFGNQVLHAESGELASGLSGQGRMMEPEHILGHVQSFFKVNEDYKGKKVLITMGPTQEALDPVRYISNHSSGKMGLALAEAFSKRGAKVFVVSGPIALEVSKEKFHWNSVISADEMYKAAAEIHPRVDICVFTAAVADYAPVQIATEKIKKDSASISISFRKNVDIAMELGKMKRVNQIHVGFALETENEVVNAKAKLKSKNFDLIVLNSTKVEGAGFKVDTNQVELFGADGRSVHMELTSKTTIATLILDQINTIPVWV
jgi:phosphopantothenoylcysteine decarboxylase/phosphopantothenate--cysteine ligase